MLDVQFWLIVFFVLWFLVSLVATCNGHNLFYMAYRFFVLLPLRPITRLIRRHSKVQSVFGSDLKMLRSKGGEHSQRLAAKYLDSNL
jgi:hypothetical protein